ncbi:hypothetical protein chiPu_0002805 [Chiloscyllium punctatum]|uniref:Anti-Mullerian hormone N-terminal domain-containing protein n=1 Tax=Chiloscyllium punctatum TaxID=137246 RepID=A0A401S1Y6_CHIPU|nr:hypothetical protein [Chiloscyllium punctatum]
MVLVLWIPIDPVKTYTVGEESIRSSSSGWSRKVFKMLNGKVLCRRRADPGQVGELLRKGDLSIDTFCKYLSSSRRNGGVTKKAGGERLGLIEQIEDKSDLMALVSSQGCLNTWERQILQAFLQTRLPTSTFSWCDAEKGATPLNSKPRLNLHSPHRVITLPLIQVSWKEEIELEFQNSLDKETLKEVKLLGAYLVFFLGDKEKDWLQSEGRNFSLTLRKGKWSKYEPVCIDNDSNYIILELPTKACKWFCSRSLHLSMQMRLVTVDGRNGLTASQQNCGKGLEAAQCEESLPQKLLFGWDEKRYTRIPPIILAILKNKRSTNNKDP